MIDLSKNTNPYYPKNKMIKFLKKNIEKALLYLSPTPILEKENYFNRFNVKNNNIMLTSGSMNGLNIILKSLNKTKAGYFNPTFWGFDYNAKFQKNKEIYSMNSLAELYINEYINEFDKLDKVRKQIKLNFVNFVDSLHCSYIDEIINKDGPFVLVKIKDDININNLINYFNEHNIVISHVNKYYKNLHGSYIRISAGKPKDMKKLSNIMNKFDNLLKK